MCNIFLIIAIVCYFIAFQNVQNYYTAGIFSFGAFAAMRMILLGCAGNWTTNAYHELTIDVYEKMGYWSLDSWLIFKEIKKMKKKFETNIWGVYSINQSSILGSLGFGLSYIVVLLQTENYGKMPKH